MKAFKDFNIVLLNDRTQQKVSCPECTPTRKNKNKLDLSVNTINGIWYCHHCGWKGSLKSGKKPIKNEYSYKELKNEYLQPKEPIYEYFKNRGISRKTLDRNKVGQEIKTISGKRKYVIAFNYYFGEKIVNVKYRSLKKEFSQTPNGERIFYKINDILTENEVIITEGEIDALSYDEIGLTNVVSIPDGAINPGTKNTDTKMKFLTNNGNFLEHIEKYYISCDNDAPGRAMSNELARRLGKSKCYLINYPDDCKDANDVLVKHGQQVLYDCYEQAKPYPVEGIYYAKDREKELYDLYDNGIINNNQTRVWPGFDKLIKNHDSNLVLVTGTPESGKTTFLDNWSINMSIENDINFGVFSPEYKSWEKHLAKLCQCLIGKPFMPGTKDRMSKKELADALNFLNEHIFRIEPPGSVFTLDDIKEEIEYLVLRHGIKGVVIDSWMKLAHLQESGETSERYHPRILNDLTKIATDYGINIYLVAHPTKLKPAVDDERNYPVARMNDISGSKSFYDICDIGISVRRVYTGVNEYDYSESYNEVHVLKFRDDYSGKKGTILFDFDTDSRRFRERNEKIEKENYINKYMPKSELGYPADWDTDELF